ncbi:odorant receptor 49b-like [Diachasma alloeum]|uniref:Odorant receptor n=1 Tax=Diachasma alloeum TaxID=454923 RepID=A0A4E0RSL1_9HYME|nr:odorant receptor 49b-like [Diachasma alloeum]THK32917.1 odorant receptor 55 [Diachasma alloeum]
MGKQSTPEFVIEWTKYTTGILFTWPPSSKSTRLTEIIFKICWYISLIFAVANVLPLLSTMYYHRNNFMKFTECLSMTLCFAQVVFKLIIGKNHYNRLQYLIEEMKTFVENASPHEREVLTKYVKRVSPFYLLYNIITLGATLVYVFGPFIMDQPFPNVAEFPFPVDEHPVYDIVFVLEAIAGVQCGCSSGFICQTCLLLWYGTIQLNFLAEKIEHVTSSQEVAECIAVHQHVLWYIEETIKIVRHVVTGLLGITTISIVCGAIHIVGNEAALKKIQSAWIQIAYAMALLALAWAAENLTAASEGVSWALYNSSWIFNSKKLMHRAAIFMTQKCQHPPRIAIGGFMPELSMEYYTKYMSAVYSFFTMVHVMLQKFEENR